MYIQQQTLRLTSQITSNNFSQYVVNALIESAFTCLVTTKVTIELRNYTLPQRNGIQPRGKVSVVVYSMSASWVGKHEKLV